MQSSKDYDDAKTALNRLGSENAALRQDNEGLHSRVKQAERDALGPRAAKDEVCAKLYAENERLKAELQSYASSQGTSREQTEK